MRRIRRASFCLFFALTAAAQAQIPQISLGTPQADGTIPVQISSSGNPLAAIQFDLTYDNSAVASLAATAGSSAASASKTLYTAALQTNTTRLMLVDVVDANQNNIPDGPLANLVVTPVQPGGTGPYTITSSNVATVWGNATGSAARSPAAVRAICPPPRSYVIASPLVPFLLLARMAKRVREKNCHVDKFVKALPLVIPALFVYVCGETMGYLAGPGDALMKVE